MKNLDKNPRVARLNGDTHLKWSIGWILDIYLTLILSTQVLF